VAAAGTAAATRQAGHRQLVTLTTTIAEVTELSTVRVTTDADSGPVGGSLRPARRSRKTCRRPDAPAGCRRVAGGLPAGCRRPGRRARRLAQHAPPL